MANAMAAPTSKLLYLDDLHVGRRFTSGTHTLDERQITAFARAFDPQPFHTDPQAANETLFRGLVASGWHTAAITMRLQVEGGLPIAAGENLHTLYEFRHLIAAGGVTFPEPDVTNCGGVTAFMKVCHLAEAFNLPVTSHGAHDVTVHLLAAAPNRSYLEAHGFGLDRFIAEPLRLEAGAAVAPERPGHGIEFDWKGLDAVRAR